MPKAKFKILCRKCKKSYFFASFKDKYPVCYECNKEKLHTKIEDAEMRKFFEIPETLYENNLFLRDIKLKYLNYGKLTEKQMSSFKKTVEKLSEELE